ncbi:phosphoribosylglycinamide formyltransferase [Vallitalea pronyensis]|uniref:Phosphoribosylglycinamide formyltransferase n=1 Tax=Vallitalea pronyensis TaxID=1348613 RepID=A0A8J8MMG7_9FIRM|nr:phosphoribosylglycinamide formyltransferase [Vallitalea pronyensis]QUI24390.1 phosphoribosylglycinamide formyltransferase [Vallitalea pronyensis]
MLRVGVLVSGGGTNLQAIINGIEEGYIPHTQIVSVVSNKPSAYALERIKKYNIPGKCIRPRDYASREAFSQALKEHFEALEVDLILLAGYLVVLSESFVKAFPNRIMNVHPSLIPAFCGGGFYGLKVHEYALERGVKVTGATVHFVDEGTDTGPIILQKPVKVDESDTPESLQRRVMEEAEWTIYPEAVKLYAENRIQVEAGRVRIKV